MDQEELMKELLALSIRLRELRRQVEGLMTDLGTLATDVDKLIMDFAENT